MPCDYSKYPSDWIQIRKRILERAAHRCERCGVSNYTPLNNAKGTKVILTIAHLTHDLRENDDEVLQAMCQRCHLAYDREHHRKNAAQTRARKRAANEDFI